MMHRGYIKEGNCILSFICTLFNKYTTNHPEFFFILHSNIPLAGQYLALEIVDIILFSNDR